MVTHVQEGEGAGEGDLLAAGACWRWWDQRGQMSCAGTGRLAWDCVFMADSPVLLAFSTTLKKKNDLTEMQKTTQDYMSLGTLSVCCTLVLMQWNRITWLGPSRTEAWMMCLPQIFMIFWFKRKRQRTSTRELLMRFKVRRNIRG